MNFKIKNSTLLYFPLNSKIVIISDKKYKNKKIIYIYSGEKKMIFFFEKYLFVNKWNNSIILFKDNFCNDQNKINKLFYNFFISWNSFFFNKMKFKGKGFRIRFFKRIKLIKFYFGRSHKTFYFLKKIKKKRINKYKFIVFSIHKQKAGYISKKITNIKPFNVYTLRGLRRTRQIIYKRKGKKGTYI